MSNYLPLGASTDRNAPFNQVDYFVDLDLIIKIHDLVFTAACNVFFCANPNETIETLREFAESAAKEEFSEIYADYPDTKACIRSISKQ